MYPEITWPCVYITSDISLQTVHYSSFCVFSDFLFQGIRFILRLWVVLTRADITVAEITLNQTDEWRSSQVWVLYVSTFPAAAEHFLAGLVHFPAEFFPFWFPPVRFFFLWCRYLCLESSSYKNSWVESWTRAAFSPMLHQSIILPRVENYCKLSFGRSVKPNHRNVEDHNNISTS